jgi:hypothetical protein
MYAITKDPPCIQENLFRGSDVRLSKHTLFGALKLCSCRVHDQTHPMQLVRLAARTPFYAPMREIGSWPDTRKWPCQRGTTQGSRSCRRQKPMGAAAGEQQQQRAAALPCCLPFLMCNNARSNSKDRLVWAKYNAEFRWRTCTEGEKMPGLFLWYLHEHSSTVIYRACVYI